MATPVQGRFRRARKFFRWCRIAILLLILALLGALIYLNQVGLPGVIKDPLLEKLRARGLDLQFSRLRWRQGHGLVAENVRFSPAVETNGPSLAVREMQVNLNYSALLKRQFQVESLLVKEGRLAWPVVETNGPPREVTVEKIQTELRLLPDDLWQLDDFQAQFAGAHIQLTATITNASALRELKWFHGRAAPPGAMRNRVRQLANALEKIHFTTPPQLKMNLRGDARDLPGFSLRVALDTPDADTPWGTVERARFSALLLPATDAEWAHAEINLQAASAKTRWGTTFDFALVVHLFSTMRGTNVVDADLDLTAAALDSPWGSGADLRFNAQWQHALTNAIPLSGHGELQLSGIETAWGGARELQFSGDLAQPTNAVPPIDDSWAWWTNLAPYALDWECRVSGLESPKLTAAEVVCAGEWRAPEFKADRLIAQLYGGKLEADASLDVATRQVRFNAASDFDAQQTAPLLTPKARDWIGQFTWEKSPDVKAAGGLVLPAWTNIFHQPDWRGEVQPTLRLDGQFHVERGTFRGVAATSADSHFSYSNLCWRLPDLVAIRPEGRVELFHESNDRTKDYYFRLHSTIDVGALRPVLPPNQQKGFDYVEFTGPPVIDAEVWGRWHDYEHIGCKAFVTATNFAVRTQAVSSFHSALQYTNRLLTLIEPRALRGTQELAAAGLTLDFNARKIYLTNGVGTADPLAVARAIGPKIGKVMEPYRFLQPPRVRAEGIIPMHDEEDADLHFEVDGYSFAWWKFWMPRITGHVDWVGQRLELKDVAAEFYHGTAVGNAEFLFQHDTHSADFKFGVVATDADLHLLANDLSDKTNKLEGLLTLRLDVTHANSAEWERCQGLGRATLRDGLIWDFPIFGILSPVLDAVLPGLGRSRAREGSATFTITNGVVLSEDLEIQTTMARLQYRGTIDLQGKVNARADAELLRNMWGVGPLISLVLWPVSKVFEFEIIGTLQEPTIEPVYLPKLFMIPMRPVQTLKELMPPDPPGPSTNAPPESR